MLILRWILANGIAMGAFIAGQFFGIGWAMNISLFILWITAIFGTICIFANEEMVKDVNAKYSVPHIVDIIYDIIMTALIVSQGMFVLGAFYLLHIIGAANARKLLENRDKVQ